MANAKFYGTGRRKKSIARVYLTPGTGKKLDQKVYYSHSDYVGGMKETTLKEMMAKKPEKVVELAVKGMLPKGPLGYAMIKKLKIYAGEEHPHTAQQPKNLDI